nr:MAG TPA: hypothetical protein [Caudoviricetes sp.]
MAKSFLHILTVWIFCLCRRGERAAERNLPRRRVSRGSTHPRPRLSGRDGLNTKVSRHSRTLLCQ